MGCQIVEKLAQSAQEVGTEVGTIRTQRDDQIGCDCVSPFRRQRSPAPIGAGERDAISAPDVQDSDDLEGLAMQRVERVGDSKNLRGRCPTTCNPRHSPTAASSRRTGT